MKKALLVVLSSTLMLIALFGCSSQKDGEITKVRVSKSSGQKQGFHFWLGEKGQKSILISRGGYQHNLYHFRKHDS
ncbi:hypothetical protein [Paenibacillus dakarensis]|uniref:hypothetical protein n=1 Tax=Paenibacillus dakarensis TaxID=1527293 RepID=UPI0006D536F9|nr:hypothetical protein [Paenibacillus dakarensis]